MPFNKYNIWKPIDRSRWVPDSAEKYCQFIDRNVGIRCSNRVYWGARHHCRECGILVCGKHSQYNYKNYRVCNKCYHKLNKGIQNSSAPTIVKASTPIPIQNPRQNNGNMRGTSLTEGQRGSSNNSLLDSYEFNHRRYKSAQKEWENSGYKKCLKKYRKLYRLDSRGPGVVMPIGFTPNFNDYDGMLEYVISAFKDINRASLILNQSIIPRAILDKHNTFYLYEIYAANLSVLDPQFFIEKTSSGSIIGLFYDASNGMRIPINYPVDYDASSEVQIIEAVKPSRIRILRSFKKSNTSSWI